MVVKLAEIEREAEAALEAKDGATVETRVSRFHRLVVEACKEAGMRELHEEKQCHRRSFSTVMRVMIMD